VALSHGDSRPLALSDLSDYSTFQVDDGWSVAGIQVDAETENFEILPSEFQFRDPDSPLYRILRFHHQERRDISSFLPSTAP
jgi:hypothetical protein